MKTIKLKNKSIKLSKVITLFCFTFILSSSQAQNWIQKGQDIDGEAANNFSGKSVSMPDEISITVTNTLGQIIFNKNYLNTDSIELIINEENGVYFVTMENENQQKTIKLILNKN
jgi:hypothetical protein